MDKRIPFALDQTKVRKLISEFYDPNLVKPGDFFTDYGMARVS